MPDATRAAVDVALAYQAATKTIGGRLSMILAALWGQVHPWTAVSDWQAQLPTAVGAFTAAQEASAAMADAYVGEALAAQGSTAVASLDGSALTVDPAALAGRAASGLSLENLLSIPAARAQAVVTTGGVSAAHALKAGVGSLQMYARTETADAATAAVQVSSVTHSVLRYMRVTGPLCCARCAILSGRLYKVAEFERHPNDRCSMLPVDDPRAVEVPDPATLFREGRITDLTRAETKALNMGADLSQVVNARDGMYRVGGRSYTNAGATLRGVAGARLAAADIARVSGNPRALYTNFTVSRREVAEAQAKYGPLFRRGAPFQRVTPVGVTTAAYTHAGSGRPTVAQILHDHPGHEEATRALINAGYILAERDAAASTASLERLFHAS